MTEHSRDKDQLDQARTINYEIEVSVLGPSGMDTPPCAEAWSTAKLIAELRSRVEALEAVAADCEANQDITGGQPMTDQHPLTDEICADIVKVNYSSPESSYCEDMRVAADWQLEQAFEWLTDHAGRYVEEYYAPNFDEYGLLDDFKKAMRPTDTQEDN